MTIDEEILRRVAMNDPDVKKVTGVGPRNCGDFAAALRNNTHVSFLKVSVCGKQKKEDMACQADGKLPLDIEVSEQWEAFCQAAGNLTSLTTLDIRTKCAGRNYQPITITDYGRMQRLLECTRQIKKLTLHWNRIGDLGYFEGILRPNPFLYFLAMGIKHHPALEHIDFPHFYGNPIEQWLMPHFMPILSSVIPNLKKIVFMFDEVVDSTTEDDGSVGAAFLRQLLTLPSLEHLELGHFQFRDEHSDVMEQVLSQETPKLLHFELIDCDMTMACLGSLSRAIGVHSNLQKFRSRYLEIRDYDSDRAAHLFDPLENSTLKDLDLQVSVEEDFEWPSFDFLQGIANLMSLKVLASTGDLHPQTARADSLCRSLLINRSIEDLTLEQVYLEDDDVEALVEMVRQNNNGLKRLELSNLPRLSSANLMKFVPALAENETLESLDLSIDPSKGNATSKNMVDFVKRTLQVSRLTRLDLFFHECDPEDLVELVPIMAKNFRVEKLNFDCSCSIEDTLNVTGKVYSTLDVIGKLNKFGRWYLADTRRGPQCRVAGVNLLTAVSDDLDCLYYHLRENPELCDRELENASLETVSSPNVSDDLLRFY